MAAFGALEHEIVGLRIAEIIAPTIPEVRRRLARQVLWNGNREPPLWTILTDKEHVVRWAWSTHHKTATRVAALLKEHPDFVVVRLTSRNDVERWLAGPLQTTGSHQ